MIFTKSPLSILAHFHLLLLTTSLQIMKHGMDCFQAMPVFWSWEEVTAGQDTIAEDLTVRNFQLEMPHDAVPLPIMKNQLHELRIKERLQPNPLIHRNLNNLWFLYEDPNSKECLARLHHRIREKCMTSRVPPFQLPYSTPRNITHNQMPVSFQIGHHHFFSRVVRPAIHLVYLVPTGLQRCCECHSKTPLLKSVCAALITSVIELTLVTEGNCFGGTVLVFLN